MFHDTVYGRCKRPGCFIYPTSIIILYRIIIYALLLLFYLFGVPVMRKQSQMKSMSLGDNVLRREKKNKFSMKNKIL